MTPPVLQPDQRISLNWHASTRFGPVGLLLTRQEAGEIAALASARHQDKPRYSTNLLDWLYNLTGGHVEALDGLIQILKQAPVSTSLPSSYRRDIVQ